MLWLQMAFYSARKRELLKTDCLIGLDSPNFQIIIDYGQFQGHNLPLIRPTINTIEHYLIMIPIKIFISLKPIIALITINIDWTPLIFI